jgi:hypothetical protein
MFSARRYARDHAAQRRIGQPATIALLFLHGTSWGGAPKVYLKVLTAGMRRVRCVGSVSVITAAVQVEGCNGRLHHRGRPR